MKVKSLSRVRLFTTPWTVAYQAPPSMGFPRQEYWSGLPLPSPNQMTSVLIRRQDGRLDTDTPRRPSEDRSGLWSGALTRRGTLRIADNERLAEARKDHPSRGFRGRGAADTLILDFWLPGPRDCKSLLFWATQFLVPLLQPQETNTPGSWGQAVSPLPRPSAARALNRCQAQAPPSHSALHSPPQITPEHRASPSRMHTSLHIHCLGESHQ